MSYINLFVFMQQKNHQYLCKTFFHLTTSLLVVIVPLIFYDIFIFCCIDLFLFQQRVAVISNCCCMLKIYKRRKWYHQSYTETFLASKHLWETSIRRYMDARTRTPLYYSFLFVSRKETLHSFHYNIYIQKIPPS